MKKAIFLFLSAFLFTACGDTGEPDHAGMKGPELGNHPGHESETHDEA